MQASVQIDRDKYIGGSDIPAIMGISPFKTRYQLLQEKAGLIEASFEGNEYTEYGNTMEPKIRDFINQSEKDKYVEGKDIDGDIRCHTDGINKDSVLEIKTTSHVYFTIEDYRIYLVQLLFYMNHTKRKNGKLAVYSRPEDFNTEFVSSRLQTFDIKLEDYAPLIEKIEFAVEQFRKDLERLKENPFLTEEDLLPADITELSEKVVALENRLIEYKKIEDERDILKEELKMAMDKHAVKKWITNNGTQITRIEDIPDKEVQEEFYDEDTFAKENPKLHEEYHNKLAEYKNTKIVIKKGKKGSLRITLPKEEKNE